MKKVLLTTLSLGMCYVSVAQYKQVEIEATDKLIKSESGIVGKPLQGTFIGFNNPPSEDQTWQPMLYKVSENESDDNEALEKIKEAKEQLKESYRGTEAKTTTAAGAPVVGTNFAGISNAGFYTPLDNTIAISDKDTIVAFINTKIAYYYGGTGTSGLQLYSHDIYSMINDNSITNNLCDPKVIWDNVARRYIFYVQVCDQVAANSLVIIGFSKTSNPMDGWFHYKFTGNPLNNGSFWDYPKMAVSTDDLYVTGNLFGEGGGPYNTSAIYQIQKAPCFAGTALTPANSKYYTTFNFTPLPIGYGQPGSYGPGIYIVSTNGTTNGSNSFKLMQITNNIASGLASLNTYNVTTSTYANAGNASQLGSSWKLDVLDCRSMDGFYLKGTIHFVFGKDIGSGWAGVSYNRLTVSSLTDVNSSFGNMGTSDYAFPAIASPGNDSNDKSVILSFNESGAAMYPRTCVARCDNSMNWSAPVLVKAGASYINYGGTTGTKQRWGDYNGMCKRFGDPTGTVWMAGMYGGVSNYWLQWIAKINPFTAGVPMVNNTNEQTSAKVYPNPIVDNYSIKFDVPERQNIIINITDMQGRSVVELYNNIAEKGQNAFSFNKGSLTNGIYSLNIIGATTNIRNEKIVVTGK